MMQKKLKSNHGFIALISAIIISVVLLLVATNASLTSFYGRSNILDGKLKVKSSALAEACADHAILKLTINPSYNPTNEVVPVESDTCIVQSVTSNNPKIILIQADYRNSITKLRVKVDPATFSVTSWEEI